MQTTCAVLTPRVVWCRARAPAGLAKLSQLLALSPWHLIAHGRSESSSKEQISARAFISEIRAAYRPLDMAWSICYICTMYKVQSEGVMRVISPALALSFLFIAL